MSKQKFVEISKSFFIDPDYKTAFSNLGLTSIDAVFSFNAGKNLAKSNLAAYRSRLQFETGSPPTTLFLKRYDTPPIMAQLKSWLCHRSRASLAFFEFDPAHKLAEAGINTPKIIACGEQWATFFEKRSFIISEKIPNADALERKLPPCFTNLPTRENLKLRRNFIAQAAVFVKKFHQTGFRHRDFYLSHIFHTNSGEFYLIDLARVFKPVFFAERFRRKDIAQLYYSAPAKCFSSTDRLRFYIGYTGRQKLNTKDKAFIRKIISKSQQMARHDTKHGRYVPFAG